MLPEYLRKTGVDYPLPAPVLDVLDTSESVNIQEDMSVHRTALGLLEHDNVVEIMQARGRWLDWRICRDQINFERDAEGKDLLPLEWIEETAIDHELPVLSRALNSLENGGVTFVGLWRTAIQSCLAGSVGEVTAPKKKHPRADSNKSLHGAVDNLAELDSNRWMLIVRALKEGSITLNWTHPTDEIQTAGEAALKESELDLGRRKPTTVIRELITNHLDEGLQSELTRLSKEELVSIAAGEYARMLCTPAVTQYPVGGIYIGTDKQRLGLATLDKRGSVTTTAPVRPSGDWPDRVCRWIQDNRVRMVVIPTTASASSWLSELEVGLEKAGIEYSSVSPSGMFAARAADDPVLRRVSPEIASAIVLARRAMQPIEAWSRVEPVKLGLVPMSAGIDDVRLSELLLMVRERCIAESQPLLNTPVGDSGIRQRGNASLNPTVRGIRDLRPGLSLNGVVSNVTKFGAFVNVGVRQEGLVHISELSNDFVEDPNEIVQVGNPVQVRVISVDLERGRIALTMRTESARMSTDGSPMRSGGSPRGAANDGPGRNRALQDLESLFRKSSSSDESDGTSSDSSTD